MTPAQRQALEKALHWIHYARRSSGQDEQQVERDIRAALAEGSSKTCAEPYSTTANLPHCPFCRSKPRYLEHKTGFYTERVICEPCGYHLPPETWNMRNGTTPETSETKGQK